MDEDTTDDTSHSSSDRLKFHYQKAPSYRTIHCDGALGGITPRRHLAITLYHERNTIPRLMSREITQVGEEGHYTLGPERVDDDLGGVMRQLEATVVIDLTTAQELYTWLRSKVEQLEDVCQVAAQDRVVKKEPEN